MFTGSVLISTVMLITSPLDKKKMGSVRHLDRAAEALEMGHRSVTATRVKRPMKRVILFIGISLHKASILPRMVLVKTIYQEQRYFVSEAFEWMVAISGVPSHIGT